MTVNISEYSPIKPADMPPAPLPALLSRTRLEQFVMLADESGLWEHHATRTYLYMRPGSGFSVWCFDGYGWFEHLPNWPLLTPDGGPAVLAADRDNEEKPQREVELIFSWPEMENQETREELLRRDELRKLGQTQPDAIAASVTQYVGTLSDTAKFVMKKLDHFQWCALEAMCLISGFDTYIEDTINRFGPNLFNLAWNLGSVLERSKSWRLHVSRQLMQLSPQKLISWLSCRQIAASPMRVIAKVGSIPREQLKLRSLANILAQPGKMRRLLQIAHIKTDLLVALDLAPAWLITPRLVRLMGKVRNYHLSELEFTLGSVRRTVTKDGHINGLVSYLETSRNADKFYERLEFELTHFDWKNTSQYQSPGQRARQPFPTPPFASDETFVAIASAKHLKRVGLQMRNCLPTFEAQIRAGNTYAYEWKTEPRIAFVIHRSRKARRWRLQQIGTIENAALPNDVGSRLRGLLQPRLDLANSAV